jgi:hypothetical protein
LQALRVALGLVEVLDRDHAAQVEILADHENLLDPVLVQQALHLAASAPSRTVTSLSRGVMIADTGLSSSVSKRMSRRVTMPTRSSPASTGTPEMPCAGSAR